MAAAEATAIGNADKGLQRMRFWRERTRVKINAPMKETQAHPVRANPVGVHADQNRHGCSQSRNLRQSQIDEDDASLDHMHA